MIDTAFVFTAGFGKRLLPITQTIPKPMVKVADKMLVEHILDRLSAAGIKKVIMNTHHLAEVMQQAITQLQTQYPSLEIISIHEETILETGGGLVNALPLLGSRPIFTINGDILWENNSDALLQMQHYWDESKMDILMLLQEKETAIGYEGRGDFDLAPLGNVFRRTNRLAYPYVFTGIQIINPEVLKEYEVVPFSLRKIYDSHLQSDGMYRRIYGMKHAGQWLHIGTVEGLKLAEEAYKKLDKATVGHSSS